MEHPVSKLLASEATKCCSVPISCATHATTTTTCSKLKEMKLLPSQVVLVFQHQVYKAAKSGLMQGVLLLLLRFWFEYESTYVSLNVNWENSFGLGI